MGTASAAIALPTRGMVHPRASRGEMIVALAVGESSLSAVHAPATRTLLREARQRVLALLDPSESCWIANGVVYVRMRRGVGRERHRRIQAMTQSLVEQPIEVDGACRHLDVGVAVETARPGRRAASSLADRARDALSVRDLAPAPRPRTVRAASERSRTPLQLAMVFAALFVVPLGLLMAAHRSGIPLADWTLVIVLAVMFITVVLQWTETIIGARSQGDPPTTDLPAPRASAIVAAYLPNEEDSIVDTVERLLRHDYTGELQVILAYNTPEPLAVEAELLDLAHRDPRLVIARVEGSTSKAHNVNAAISLVRGEFVGIFDADHQPDPGAFDRAWRWLASGYDVVQGHCVIRNGDESGISRAVAVEFEQIYAVSHPGRMKLHGYGIFAGSNGYWRSDLLRATRMHSSMLTEDIDSSLRAIRAGARIRNDPGLISRELAPTTLPALWRQRMRWAQGWTQVATKHAGAVVWGDELTVRQRAGLFFHMLWRELYPVLSALMLPLLTFYIWRDGGVVFHQAGVVLMAFALSTTPLALVLTKRVADREIASRSGWWWSYLFVSMLFYQEFKNIIARVGVVKLLMRERKWVVTPRSAAARRDEDIPAPVCEVSVAPRPRVTFSTQSIPVVASASAAA